MVAAGDCLGTTTVVKLAPHLMRCNKQDKVRLYEKLSEILAFNFCLLILFQRFHLRNLERIFTENMCHLFF